MPPLKLYDTQESHTSGATCSRFLHIVTAMLCHAFLPCASQKLVQVFQLLTGLLQ